MKEAVNIDSPIQYIARISHGKDSLKMLDVIISRGLPLDRITTTDIWATDTIRGELPEMVKFKEMADEYIWKKYHIEVEHLCAMKNGEKLTYEKMFYHIPKRKPTSAGGGNGSETRNNPRISNTLGSVVQPRPQNTRDYRQDFQSAKAHGARSSSTDGYQTFSTSPTARGGKNVVEYLGIAADEPKRFGQLNEWKRAPLVEFGIEEELCGLHCKYAGILSPTYETSCRDGCWFCHNQGVESLRQLRKQHPELWGLLLKWDKDSSGSFHPDGRTVHDFDRRFQLENDGFIPSDKRFFWKMLDEPLQMRMF